MAVRARLKKSRVEEARANVEALANNIYYSLMFNNHILRIQAIPLPIEMTIDEILDIDFIMGNLLEADAIMQKAQRISS
jgi:hypothetical protein